MGTYVDTSALIKRYVHEPNSQSFDDFVAERDEDVVLSPLTLVELQWVLMHRLRERAFDRATSSGCTGDPRLFKFTTELTNHA